MIKDLIISSRIWKQIRLKEDNSSYVFNKFSNKKKLLLNSGWNFVYITKKQRDETINIYFVILMNEGGYFSHKQRDLRGGEISPFFCDNVQSWGIPNKVLGRWCVDDHHLWDMSVIIIFNSWVRVL